MKGKGEVQGESLFADGGGDKKVRGQEGRSAQAEGLGGFLAASRKIGPRPNTTWQSPPGHPQKRQHPGGFSSQQVGPACSGPSYRTPSAFFVPKAFCC